MSEQTVLTKSTGQQGLYQWSFTYKDGSYIDKYPVDEQNKNLYVKDGRVLVNLQDCIRAEFYKADGSFIAGLDVPDGAVVFQRRRGGATGSLRVNYYDRWHPVTVPGYEDKERNCWIPGYQRMIPEVNYDEVYLIGYRKREADNSVTVKFLAVYPETRNQPQLIDEHNGWTEKPWLFEPDWFPQEQV